MDHCGGKNSGRLAARAPKGHATRSLSKRPHYGVVEAAVLIALVAYFALGAVAIVFESTR
jgi:hypothetical protein